MSFGRHGEIFSEGTRSKGQKRPESRPRPSVGTSFRLAIPWLVALQQSRPRFANWVPVSIRRLGESRNSQSTVHCLLTVCLTPGGRFIPSPAPFYIR
jgi:hypothetical protein